jgi:hypothetical protein
MARYSELSIPAEMQAVAISRTVTVNGSCIHEPIRFFVLFIAPASF